MELRYKRRMKMPITTLPGFSSGTPTNNWRQGIGNAPQLDTSFNYGAAQNYLATGSWDTPQTTLGTGTIPTNSSMPVGTTGNKLGAVDWGAIGQGAIQLTGATINSFSPVKKTNELYADAGQTIAHGAGFDFRKQNAIDEKGEMSDLRRENLSNTLTATSAGVGLGTAAGVGIGVASGAALGGVAGPIGAGIGALVGLGIGLIGSKHRKNKMRQEIYNAQQNIIRQNTYSRTSAQTDYLTQQYYNENGNTQDDMLYSAATGKESGAPVIPAGSIKERVRQFNRKLTLPNIKNNE